MSEVTSLRPLAALLVSALAIVAIVASRRRPNVREGWTMVAALTKLGIVLSMVPGVLAGTTYVADSGPLVSGIRLALRVDALGLLFGLLASGLWVITSLYSVGYMRGLDEGSQTRYFASFAASLSAAIGVAFASNLVTLFVFYELLTVATYPLVAHDETAEARQAGRKYLAYTFLGGVSVLTGTVLVYWLTGTTAFTPGGIAALADADPTLARLTFALLAGGFGVKAALMPLHSWLPDAMVAPTPVSGLLHAVAVVKSGVFGIARVSLDVFGPETMGALGVGLPLAAVAAFTLLTASVIALRKDNLKRRLAYSTVSQLSYIVLGLGVLSPAAIVGGLLHIPAHAFMKLTLFFCAGAIHVETHTDDISDMAGIGRRMPLTMTAFAVASAGMAGIPLLAGFVSKWYLLIGSVDAGHAIFAAALLVSGILNVAYFWPVVYQAFFETADDHDPKPLVAGVLGGRFGTAAGGAGERERPTRADGGRPDDSDGAGPEESAGTAAEGSADPDSGDSAEGPTESADGPGDSDDEPETPTEDSWDSRDHGFAVDHKPSDVDVPHGDAAPDAGAVDEDEDARGPHGASEEHGHGHHGGPPPGGWEPRGWRGDESTWFMLGPILAAAAGAVALGVAPYGMVFLRIVERVAANVGVIG